MLMKKIEMMRLTTYSLDVKNLALNLSIITFLISFFSFKHPFSISIKDLQFLPSYGLQTSEMILLYTSLDYSIIEESFYPNAQLLLEYSILIVINIPDKKFVLWINYQIFYLPQQARQQSFLIFGTPLPSTLYSSPLCLFKPALLFHQPLLKVVQALMSSSLHIQISIRIILFSITHGSCAPLLAL